MCATAQTAIRRFASVEPMSSPAALHPACSSQARTQPLRVLVADDSPANLERARALWSLFGIDPVLVADGTQAVRRAREQAFDLILMDLNMPMMDGLTATGQIRRFDAGHATHPQVVVVAYTGSPFPSDAAHLRRFGLDAVLRKPCLPEDLAALLERHYPGRFNSAYRAAAWPAPLSVPRARP